MREALQQHDGERLDVIAYLCFRGTRRGSAGEQIPVVLVKNIINAKTGELLTDHAWIQPKHFRGWMQANGNIYFKARVRQYRKGRNKNIIDYEFYKPSQPKALNNWGQ